MILPSQIIQQTQEDPVAGALSAIQYTTGQVEGSHEWSLEDHDLLLELYALLSALQETGLLTYNQLAPNTDIEMRQACGELWQFMQGVRDQLVSQASAQKLAAMKQHFALTVGNGFGYEFTEGDLNRIQALLNELRDLVAKADDLEPDHKQRLLKRLEHLQRELHKKTSDLSRYYGLIGEAGVALGKFGTDAKPIVDRVKEILQIVWNTQARAEELPSGTTPPLLEKDSE